MTFRSLFAAGTLIAAFASTAAAQFTSVVVPPRQPRSASAGRAQTGSAAAQARRDTSVVARLTDMKAWVDSAAGLSAPRAVASAQDSSARASAPATQTPATQRVDSAARPRSGQTAGRTASTGATGTQTFREGATAPNTASLLPLIALFGAGTLLLGLTLLRQGARVPVRRRR